MCLSMEATRPPTPASNATRLSPVRLATALPALSVLAAKATMHRPLLPWCIACMGIIFAGLAVADKFVLFPNSRNALLFVLSIPLLYFIWALEESLSRTEAQRMELADQHHICESRIAEVTRELAQERTTLKDTRDARSGFLVRTVLMPLH